MKHCVKICLVILLCAVMTAGLLPGTLVTAVAEEYSLWVGGVRVTSDNLSGAGWEFNPASNILALNGFTYTGKGAEYQTNTERFWAAIKYHGSQLLTITLTGSSQIRIQTENEQTNDRLCGLYSTKDVTVQGSGVLDIQYSGSTAHDNTGIYLPLSPLTIESGTVNVTGGTAASGRSTGISARGLAVNGGTVTAAGGTASGSNNMSYGISTSGSVAINGGSVTAIGGATDGAVSYGILGDVAVGEDGRLTASGSTKAIEGTVKNAVAGNGWYAQDSISEGINIGINTDGQSYDYKEICFPERIVYPLYVGGKRVTSDNLAGSGWSFTPKTDSAPNMLTLNGFSYSGEGMSYNVSGGSLQAAILYTSNSDPLVLSLAGSNEITATGSSKPCGILSNADITIEGSGSLNVSVDSTASYGKVGMDVRDLTVNGGTVTVAGGGTTDGSGIGISAGAVEVNNGTLTVTGESVGIAGSGTVTIGTGGRLNASGSTKAINGTVKNAVAGSGWYVLNSTSEGIRIAVNTDGQRYDYKEVCFPERIIYPLYVGGKRVTSDKLSGTGWSFTPKTDSAPNMLTLNGFSYSGEGMSYNVSGGSLQAAILYTSNSDPLVLSLAGSNEITATGSSKPCGILSTADITIEGSGSLNVSVNNTASASSDKVGMDVAMLTVNGGTVTVAGGEATDGLGRGISAGTVEVNDGTLTATGENYGISASEVTVNGGTLTATGKNYGIGAGEVTVNGGTAAAAGGNVGIAVTGKGTVSIGTGGRLTASGSTKAIDGTVKNAVAGSGWTVLNSTSGGALIGINTSGQNYYYKKICFPELLVYSLWVGGTQVTSDNLSGTGWTYTPASNTLALNGFTYTGKGSEYATNSEHYWSAIQYTGSQLLTITLAGSSQIRIQPRNEQTNDRFYGLYSTKDVTVQGTGVLDIQYSGATAHSNTGINLPISSLTVESGTINVTAGTSASGRSTGICADSLTVNGGTVTAAGGTTSESYNQSYGIDTPRPVVINGGSVTAIGGTTNGAASYGIFGDVTIGENGRLSASGLTKAVYGTVKNAVAGEGYTNSEGTEGWVIIPVSTDGRVLYNLKVIFPAAYLAYGETSFILPSGITTIQANAFEGDMRITVVDAGNCTAIGSNAFKDCTGLTRIRLPKDCDIAPDAFEGCGIVYVFAPAGGSTEEYCNDLSLSHHCRLVPD